MSKKHSCVNDCGLSQMKDLLDILAGLRRELEAARQECRKLENQRMNAEAMALVYRNRLEEAKKTENTRHGVWRYHSCKMTCSCCDGTFRRRIGQYYEYCPRCGATMDGGTK